MASPDDSIIYYPSLMFCHCPNGQDTPHPNFTFSASARYKRRKKSRATLTQCDFEPWSGFFSFLNRRRGGEEGHGTHMPHFSFLAWVDKFFFARDPKKILFPIVSPPPSPPASDAECTSEKKESRPFAPVPPFCCLVLRGKTPDFSPALFVSSLTAEAMLRVRQSLRSNSTGGGGPGKSD